MVWQRYLSPWPPTVKVTITMTISNQLKKKLMATETMRKMPPRFDAPVRLVGVACRLYPQNPRHRPRVLAPTTAAVWVQNLRLTHSFPIIAKATRPLSQSWKNLAFKIKCGRRDTYISMPHVHKALKYQSQIIKSNWQFSLNI